MTHHKQRIVKFFLHKRTQNVLVGVGAGIIMLAVRSLFSAQIGADALYHITHARYIAEAGDWSTVHPWIVHHFFSTFPANPYILAHSFLAILLALFGSHAANIWVAIQVGSVVGIFFYILRAHQIRYPFVWTIISFMSSSALLFRLSLARPFVLGVGLFLLGVHFIMTKRWRALIVLSGIYLLYYNFAIVLGAYAALSVSVEFITKKKFNVYSILSVFGGFLIALLIHPHTLGYINVISIHAVTIPWLTVIGIPLLSGQEITAQVPSQIAAGFILSLVALCSLTGIALFKYKTRFLYWALLLWCLIWMILTFFMPRAIEYWILPTWLLAALMLKDTTLVWPSAYKYHQRLATYGVSALILLILFANTVQALSLISQSGNDSEEQNAATIAQTLTEISPVSSTVYYPNWALFPKLFAHNDHNTYLVGFDPVFQYIYSQDMYWLWHNISVSATLCTHRPPCSRLPTDEELTLLFTTTFDAPYLVLPTGYADKIRERIVDLPTAVLLKKTPTLLLYEIHQVVDE